MPTERMDPYIEHITNQLIGARRTSEHWKSELAAANKRIAELERAFEQKQIEIAGRPAAWMWQTVESGTRVSLNEPADYEEPYHLEPLFGKAEITAAVAAGRIELERENERLRSIVRKGRDTYSAYGILVTLPGHAMYSEAGAKLRSEWLRETDEYLREIDQAREKG